MFKFHTPQATNADALISSKLFDQDSFYPALMDDLRRAKSQVVIECPFITAKRMESLLPLFRELSKKGVQLVINTKPLDEHEPNYYVQAEAAINALQAMGVLVLFTVGHHRKIVVIDECITWEGSLNILSQNDSCEFMRRIYSDQLAIQMLSFLQLERFIG